MHKLEVNSLPVNEVLKDLSKLLNLPYVTNCREHNLEITGDVGEGYIRAMMLESGLGFIEYNCKFNSDLELRFVKDSVHPIKFLYCTEGQFKHRFASTDIVHKLHRFQQAIVASIGNNGHIITFKKDIHITLYSLEMNRKEFMIWDECSFELVQHQLNDIFGDYEAENEFYHEGYYSLELADVFNEIKRFDDNYFLKTIFMISCGYKLLGKQILQYQDDLNQLEDRHVIRQNEVSKIYDAARFINETISKSSTIEMISEKIGLSELKLQYGFKLLYNTTVNGYMNDMRLDHSAKLLRTTNLNISEIIYKVGLTSRSYFSRIFKERYHCTPTEYRQKAKFED